MAQGQLLERQNILGCKLLVHAQGPGPFELHQGLHKPWAEAEKLLASAASDIGHLTTLSETHSFSHCSLPLTLNTSLKKRASSLAVYLELTYLSAIMLTFSAEKYLWMEYSQIFTIFHSQVKFRWRAVLGNNIKIKLPWFWLHLYRHCQKYSKDLIFSYLIILKTWKMYF